MLHLKPAQLLGPIIDLDIVPERSCVLNHVFVF